MNDGRDIYAPKWFIYPSIVASAIFFIKNIAEFIVKDTINFPSLLYFILILAGLFPLLALVMDFQPYNEDMKKYINLSNIIDAVVIYLGFSREGHWINYDVFGYSLIEVWSRYLMFPVVYIVIRLLLSRKKSERV